MVCGCTFEMTMVLMTASVDWKSGVGSSSGISAVGCEVAGDGVDAGICSVSDGGAPVFVMVGKAGRGIAVEGGGAAVGCSMQPVSSERKRINRRIGRAVISEPFR